MTNLRHATCIDKEKMTYHFLNLVFLGISIEGIASDKAIEILEKRGLLSRVGGGAYHPHPSFRPQFPVCICRAVVDQTLPPSQANIPEAC